MDAIAVDVDAVNPLEVYETTRELAAAPAQRRGASLHASAWRPARRALQQHRHPPLPHPRRDRGDDAHQRPGQAHGRDADRAWPDRAESDVERIHDEVKAEIDAAEDQVLAEPEVPAERVTERVIEMPSAGSHSRPAGPTRKIADDRGHQRRAGRDRQARPRLLRLRPGCRQLHRRRLQRDACGWCKEYPGTAISSALNEQLIAGIAAGCGMADDKARCGEIQFVDYHQSATQTIRLAARIYYQSYGDWNCPVILRMKSGSGGGGPISDSGSRRRRLRPLERGRAVVHQRPRPDHDLPGHPLRRQGTADRGIAHAVAGRLPGTRAPLSRRCPPRPEGRRADRRNWPISGMCPRAITPSRFGKARTLRIGSGAPLATIVSWGMMFAGVGHRGRAFRRDTGRRSRGDRPAHADAVRRAGHPRLGAGRPTAPSSSPRSPT